MRVCSPHCGLDPETSSGGETYERELLRHLAGQGVTLDLILARHKRVPEGVANWVIHRLRMGRGLRWPVAAVVFPPAIRRVYAETRFDLLRAHSLRYIGPAALRARRRLGVRVPIVIRMEGTNVEKGKQMLKDSGLNFTTADDMADAAKKVVAAAK